MTLLWIWVGMVAGFGLSRLTLTWRHDDDRAQVHQVH